MRFWITTILGPVIFIIFYLIPVPESYITLEAWHLIGIILWMVVWWISAIIPLNVTALLPLVLMPIFLHLPLKAIASNYMAPVILLFFGGFVLGIGVHKSGLDRRIALNIIRLLGTSPKAIILGFMLPTAFFSMWLSNTATTLVMLPIALSIINVLGIKKDNPFIPKLLISIAYSASIGGVGTLIGTPPNALLFGFAQKFGSPISFGQWMIVGVPAELVLLAVAIFIFLWRLPSFDSSKVGSTIQDLIDHLGPVTKREKIVMALFVCTAFGWIFSGYLAKWLHLPISATWVSVLSAILFFTIPVNLKKMKFVLSWEDARDLPWNVLLLFGGGMALAYGITATGLSGSIGQIFSAAHIAALVVVIIMVLITTAMTEVNSNTATAAALIPIVMALAQGTGLNPLLYGIPVSIAASFAFMLPTATPPNSIVYGSGMVKINQMVRHGFILSITGIVTAIVLYLAIIQWIW